MADHTVNGTETLQSGTNNYSQLTIAGTLHLSSDINHAVPTVNADHVTILAGGRLDTTLGGYNESLNHYVNGPVTNNGTIGVLPSLTINGDLDGTGSISIGYISDIASTTLMLNGAVSAGQTINFEKNLGTLVIGNVQGFQGTIVTSLVSADGRLGNSFGDQIVLKDVPFSSITGYNYVGDSNGGVLNLAQGGTTISLNLKGDFNNDSFKLSDGPGGNSLDIGVHTGVNTLGVPPGTVCFVSGTLIRTPGGDMPVERLHIGDKVMTAAGEARPIKWIGHRRLSGIGGIEYGENWPVRVMANAIAPGQPSRDLYLSPGHALCVSVLEELLIPVGNLLNDSTIAQLPVDTVDYWHVELESHDVLLANNLPVESYLDVGNRAWFAGKAAARDAISDQSWARPFVERGPVIDAIRSRLDILARRLGWSTTPDMDLHLVVDGVRVDGDADDELARFLFPASAEKVELRSATFVPERQGICGDSRRLGVAVTGMTLEDGFRHRVDLSIVDDLLDGLHELQEEQGQRWRWTKGAVPLAPSLWQDFQSHVSLRVGLLPLHKERWIAPRVEKLDSLRLGNIFRLRA